MAIFQKLNASSSLRAPPVAAASHREARGGSAGADASSRRSRTSDLEERPIEDALDDVLGAERRRDARLREEIARARATRRSCSTRIELDSKARGPDRAARARSPSDEPDAKVIIFTQFRDTQDYLARPHPASRGPCTSSTGSSSRSEKDAAVARFRDGERPAAPDLHRGRRRGPQLPVLPHPGQLRPAVEPDEGRAAHRPPRPHRPEACRSRSSTSRRQGTIEERVVEVLSEPHRRLRGDDRRPRPDPRRGRDATSARSSSLAEEEARASAGDLEQQLESRVARGAPSRGTLADLIMDTKSFRKDEVEELLERRGYDGQRRPAAVRAQRARRSSTSGSTTTRRSRASTSSRFGARFFAAFPQFARDDMKRRVTFDPSVALDHEEIDFLAFGHALVDALVARVRDHGLPAAFRARDRADRR